MTLPVSGIYKITNLNNNKVYVGQSQNVFERRKEHFSALYSGKHPNAALQDDWNKTGGRGFRWNVVEFCALSQLNEREKYWIDHLNTMAPHGYNLDWVPYKRKTATKRRKGGYHRTVKKHK